MKLLKKLYFAIMVLLQLAFLIPALILIIVGALIQLIVSDMDKNDTDDTK